MSLPFRFRLDPYILTLFGAIALAAILPVRGTVETLFDGFTTFAIALLFFLYGAKLSTRAVAEGLGHWRLQGTVLLATYVAFPILGVIIGRLTAPWLQDDLTVGLIYLALMPSTVQSSITFTAIARGNVPAALTSASVSNLLGVFISPLLVGLILGGASGGFHAGSIINIALQILVPFIAGQLARPLIARWLGAHQKLTGLVDRGVIVLIVYGAFSKGMTEGIWSRVDAGQIVLIAVISTLFLGLVMVGIRAVTRAAGFDRKDSIAILFCGSKKSMATGIPMAGILFSGPSLALIVLPLMIFHQIQLFVCAILAQKFAAECVNSG